MIQLYREQKKYAREILKQIRENGVALLQLPTGQGKTLIALKVAAEELSHSRQAKPIVLVTRKRQDSELLASALKGEHVSEDDIDNPWVRDAIKAKGLKGLHKGKQPKIGKVECRSAKDFRHPLPIGALVIVDEVHRFQAFLRKMAKQAHSGTPGRQLTDSRQRRFLLLSATPINPVRISKEVQKEERSLQEQIKAEDDQIKNSYLDLYKAMISLSILGRTQKKELLDKLEEGKRRKLEDFAEDLKEVMKVLAPVPEPAVLLELGPRGRAAFQHKPELQANIYKKSILGFLGLHQAMAEEDSMLYCAERMALAGVRARRAGKRKKKASVSFVPLPKSFRKKGLFHHQPSTPYMIQTVRALRILDKNKKEIRRHLSSKIDELYKVLKLIWKKRAKRNTVHFTILMTFWRSILGKGFEPRRRNGKLLILRLTPRGLRRLRLDTTRSSKISSNTASWNSALSSGGNSVVDRQLTTDDPHCVNKRQPIGVLIGFDGRFMHQAANGEVGHHETVELLTDQIGCLAPKDNPRAPQVGLEFIQCRFNLPTFMIEGGQLMCWSQLGIEDRCDQSINGLGPGYPFQPILDDSDDHAVGFVPAVPFGGVNPAQIGAIGQASLARQPQVLPDPPEQLSTRRPCLVPKLESKELPIREAQHPMVQPREHSLGQGNLSRAITSHLAAKQHVGAAFHQRDESDLRISTLAPLCPRTPEGIFVGPLIGYIQGAAVQAHHMPTTIPRSLGCLYGNGSDHFVVQSPQRLHPQSGPRLRNPRLPGHLDPDAGMHQPLNPFQETTQYLPIGALHIEHQRNHVVDHDVCRQVSLANTLPVGCGQYRLHRRQRKGLGDYSEADVIRDPAPLGEFCKRACHLWSSLEMGYPKDTTKLRLSEQYYP